ncbi:hypothetical protein T4D_112 [Trichinella pseudospiralis]|uniref:Uncharacterized protein n=1 Tax=Trichinella pseudospiralis TaxID=6337 RepID=A0A0V1FSP5_TRIPS|nr:hypothetical protein T4D_112 [Trichinella pseudospiralis]
MFEANSAESNEFDFSEALNILLIRRRIIRYQKQKNLLRCGVLICYLITLKYESIVHPIEAG